VPEKQEGGLNLATRESIVKGGDSRAALVAGKPKESLLVEAVEYLSEPKMPPSGKLPAEKIEILRRWVESGAAWPKDSPLSEGGTIARRFQITEKQKQWWAFQPRSDARPPEVRAVDWPRNDLDRFVLAKLEKAASSSRTEHTERTAPRRIQPPCSKTSGNGKLPRKAPTQQPPTRWKSSAATGPTSNAITAFATHWACSRDGV
jgi:hypothetical protein